MAGVKPYRPANGTAGMAFDDAWCARCQRDAAWREDENAATCDILTRTLIHDIGDPEYPAEWVEDEAGPRCTAFLAIGADLELEAARADPRQESLPI